MLRLVATRIGAGLLTLWVASVVVFFATELLPGDAAQAALGQQATPQQVELLRREFGLDRPALHRYVEWLGGFVQGDFGLSLPSKQPVVSIIDSRVRNTAALAALTIALLIPISLFLGIVSAMRRDSLLDRVIASTSLALISTPEFVVGSLLALLLAVRLGWFPPASLIDAGLPLDRQFQMFVLPVLTLLAAEVAQTTRMIRAAMIDVLDSDFVTMARLKGVPEARVLLRHALPNALAPTLQILAFNVAWLTGGVVVVENVFQFPGLGLALTSAVAGRDGPTVECITMLVTGLYILANLLADIGVIALNPRLRRSL